MIKFSYALHAKRKWLSDCAERNAVLGFLFNQMIILAPALKKERHTGRHWFKQTVQLFVNNCQ